MTKTVEINITQEPWSLMGMFNTGSLKEVFRKTLIDAGWTNGVETTRTIQLPIIRYEWEGV